MAKKMGIYILLCALSLWVSPGVGAAVCAEVVAQIDSHHHGHTHSAEESDHSHNANHADACCVKIFVNGVVAFLQASPSIHLISSQKTAVWSGSPTLYPYNILHSSKFLSSIFLEGLPPIQQRPRFVLFSTFLI